MNKESLYLSNSHDGSPTIDKIYHSKMFQTSMHDSILSHLCLLIYFRILLLLYKGSILPFNSPLLYVGDGLPQTSYPYRSGPSKGPGCWTSNVATRLARTGDFVYKTSDEIITCLSIPTKFGRRTFQGPGRRFARRV